MSIYGFIFINFVLMICSILNNSAWPILSRGNLGNRLVKDAYGHHIEITSYAISDKYTNFDAKSGCACKRRCQIEKKCKIVSIIRHEGTTECRHSSGTFHHRSLIYTNSSITYYTPLAKPNGKNLQIKENWFYDKQHGLFYRHFDDLKPMVDAKNRCQSLGGHLPIFRTNEQVASFHDIARKIAAGNGQYLYWIDLIVRVIDDVNVYMVWGNGELYDYAEFSLITMDFNGAFLLDGYDVRIRGNTSSMGLNGIKNGGLMKYPVLCQLDPFELNGLMFNGGPTLDDVISNYGK